MPDTISGNTIAIGVTVVGVAITVSTGGLALFATALTKVGTAFTTAISLTTGTGIAVTASETLKRNSVAETADVLLLTPQPLPLELDPARAAERSLDQQYDFEYMVMGELKEFGLLSILLRLHSQDQDLRRKLLRRWHPDKPAAQAQFIRLHQKFPDIAQKTPANTIVNIINSYYDIMLKGDTPPNSFPAITPLQKKMIQKGYEMDLEEIRQRGENWKQIHADIESSRKKVTDYCARVDEYLEQKAESDNLAQKRDAERVEAHKQYEAKHAEHEKTLFDAQMDMALELMKHITTTGNSQGRPPAAAELKPTEAAYPAATASAPLEEDQTSKLKQS